MFTLILHGGYKIACYLDTDKISMELAKYRRQLN